METLTSPDWMFHLDLGGGHSTSLPMTLEGGDGSSILPLSGTELICGFHWTRSNRLVRLDLGIINQGDTPIYIEAIWLDFQVNIGKENPDWRVFLDAGECAWCGVKELSSLEWSPVFDVVAEQRIKEPDDRSDRFHRSSLQTVLYDASAGYAWLFGFLRQRAGYNGIDVFPAAHDHNNLEKVTAWQLPGVMLEPGSKLDLDPMIIKSGADPLTLLEEYAQLVKDHQEREFAEPPIVGMMTWYGYRTAIDSDIILANADLVADLFLGYPQPMQPLMLLDHGWQPDANWGYWEESDPIRFPQGMQWLGEELEKRGLDLALWYTPFCITENCPTWDSAVTQMARDDKEAPYNSNACVWGHLPGHSTGNWPIFFFDGSREDVQDKWMREFTLMTRDWNCSYWKLDFFALISSAARRKSNPIGELYARTYENFRQSAGTNAHLAPCSCDTNIQLGYNNSIRIAADIGNAGKWPAEMGNYARGFTTVAALWYKHRRFWVNDPDSIQIGCGCGLNEARVRATTVAFSGGHLMVSEDLSWISPDRIEIIRRLLPAYGKAARPLDLFENVYPNDIPHIWRLPVDSDWGACDALGIFNLTNEPMQVTIHPEWFGLSPGIPFGVVEWWQQRWLGKFDGAFETTVPPADVIILHAHVYKTHPWLVSVSHHFTGGWIVENLDFDEITNQLNGELITKPGLAMSLVGTIPNGYSISPKEDFHGRANGAGGWAHEMKTSSTRTPFSIQFEKKN